MRLRINRKATVAFASTPAARGALRRRVRFHVGVGFRDLGVDAAVGVSFSMGGPGPGCKGEMRDPRYHQAWKWCTGP